MIKMLIPIGVIAILLGTAACSQENSIEADSGEPEVSTWTDAPGGGLIAQRDDDPDNGFTTRCWKRGATYTCLASTGGHTPMIRIRAFITEKPALVPSWSDLDSVGFTCTVFTNEMGDAELARETISNEQGTLKQNRYRVPTWTEYETGPWSRSEVEGFINKNNLEVKRPWFNCGHLGRVLANGSFASLATTEVNFDNVFR